MSETFFIEEDIEKLKKKVKLVDPVAIDLKLANKQKKHWIDITELGAKGDALFYDSVTNKYYSDAGFTTLATPFSAIFNSAQLIAQAQGKDLYIPSGTYLIDREMTLRSNVNIIGDFGKTTLLLSDTFVRSDDYVFRNESFTSLTKKDNLRFEGISVVYEGHIAPTFSDIAIKGVIFKLKNLSSFVFSESSIKALNKGAKPVATPVWFRGGCSGIRIYNSHIENTSCANEGGNIWISTNDSALDVNSDIKIYNNTIIKHGGDELLAIWGTGTNKDIDFYNNKLVYDENASDIICAKLITIFTSSIGTYENIYVRDNSIKLKGKVSLVFSSNVKSGTFTNVLYDNNKIIDYVGDATGNTLLSVFQTTNVDITLPETTYAQAYLRADILFSNNIYINTSIDGRRCLACADKSLLKLYKNTVKSKFTNAIIFEENGNSSILSSGNFYNHEADSKYTSIFCEAKGQDTKASFINDNIKFKTDLYLRVGGSGATTNTNIEFKGCNIDGNTLVGIQQAGGTGAITNIINNTFTTNVLQLYSGDNAYVTTLGTLNFINNNIPNSNLATMNFTENTTSLIKANSIINISGNKWANGDGDNAGIVTPSNVGAYRLFPTNKKVLNLNSNGTNVGWIKNADLTWSPYYGLDAGTGIDISATTGTATITMDSAIKTLVPTGNITLNAPGGLIGQTCKVVITTSGTTAYTVTWGSNFRTTPTLSTGIVDAKVFIVSFVCVNYIWVETSRTLAI